MSSSLNSPGNDLLPLAYAIAEEPVAGAPAVTIDETRRCIPQHYLQYNHTYKSVSEIVEDIQFDDRYPIFVSADVSADDSALMVQIGIVGYDNYQPIDEDNKLHIVYGRKWRVERNLPSTEVVQTIFLAIQKAREHEIREVLKLQDTTSGKQSTPFSGHHDTPLLAKIIEVDPTFSHLSLDDTRNKVKQALNHLEFDGLPLSVINIQEVGKERFLIDIAVTNPEKKPASTLFFPEFSDAKFSILIENYNDNAFYHDVMSEFLKLSNQYVAETFAYRGFKRFSKYVDIKRVGEVSIAIRDKSLAKDSPFEKTIKSVNQQVDSTRAPVLDVSAVKRPDILCRFENLAGHKPIQSFK